MVLPKTHLEFDIRNDFPFNSFLNSVRKPSSNPIWVLKWSHLVSVLFYKVWRCCAPLHAWQLQACICATVTQVLQPWMICGIYLGSVSCTDLKELCQTDTAMSSPAPILLSVCLLPTPSLQAPAHQTPAWSTDPPAQRHRLHIDHPTSSFFSLTDLWVSSKGRALLDAWCLGRKWTTLTKAGWKKRGEKKSILPLGTTPINVQYLPRLIFLLCNS